MVILGALLLTGIVVYLVLEPIITGREAPLARQDEETTDAQFRKRVALLQLRDAEYEHAMGKLDEEDYRALRKTLSAEALAAIRAEEEETRVGGPGGAREGDDLEAEIARARARLKGGVFCSECGRPNPPGSRFCGECGKPLRVLDPSTA